MSERELTLRDADQYDFDGTRDKIVDLLGRGFSVAYAAKVVGKSPETVRKIARSEFVERNASRQQVIEAHDQTIHWLKMKVTKRMHEAGDRWDRRDAELLLKIMDREAKLKGVDAPTTTNVNVTVEDLSDADIISQLSAAGYQLQVPTPPKALPEPTQVDDAEFVTLDGNRTPEATAGEGPQGSGPGQCEESAELP